MSASNLQHSLPSLFMFCRSTTAATASHPAGPEPHHGQTGNNHDDDHNWPEQSHCHMEILN